MRLCLKQQEAAESLGMGLDLFRRLVDRGIMPKPVDLDGNKRWRITAVVLVRQGSQIRRFRRWKNETLCDFLLQSA